MNIFKEINKEPFIKWSTIVSAIGMLCVGILFMLHRDYFSNTPILNDVFGQFGDFVGGVIGTFLTFTSFILLYLTLKSQQIEFEKQQIKSHFFELLKIHRENRDAIILKYPTFFEDSIECLNNVIYPYIKGRKNDSNKLNLDFIVAFSYLFYYYGSSGTQSRTTIAVIMKKFRDKYFINVNDQTIDEINSPLSEEENPILFGKIKKNELKDQFSFSIVHTTKNKKNEYLNITNKEPILGTYFRHLYQTVRYINQIEKNNLSDIEKYNYIKILRAQLSSYEQALLFWDTISPLGYIWEMDERKKNNPNRDYYLITRYHLVKNIPEGLMDGQVKVDSFYPDVKYDWK